MFDSSFGNQEKNRIKRSCQMRKLKLYLDGDLPSMNYVGKCPKWLGPINDYLLT